MKKSLCTIFTAGLMAALAVFPSFALEYQYDTGSTEIFIDSYGDRWASGRKKPLPGWAWVNGYCYYYSDINGNIQKGGVTPDGYTVDEEGRWIVDGVPQYNGYGTYVMGTDELYAGKNDDERWVVMKDQLEQLFANYMPGSDYAVAMMSSKDNVYCGFNKAGGIMHGISHNSQADYSYIRASIGNFWNDNPGEWGSYETDIIEKPLSQYVAIMQGRNFLTISEQLLILVKAVPEKSTLLMKTAILSSWMKTMFTMKSSLFPLTE